MAQPPPPPPMPPSMPPGQSGQPGQPGYGGPQAPPAPQQPQHPHPQPHQQPHPLPYQQPGPGPYQSGSLYQPQQPQQQPPPQQQPYPGYGHHPPPPAVPQQYPPYHGPGVPPGGPPPDERPTPGVLLGVTCWRLVVAFCAYTGYWAFAERTGEPIGCLRELSPLSSFVAMIVYLLLAAYPFVTGLRRHEPRSAWLRGATAIVLLLVAVVWATLMAGDYEGTASLYTHLITPGVVLADWAIVGRAQGRARWWYPLTWTLPPFAYLIYLIQADVTSYSSFLDPGSGDFLPMCLALTAAVVAMGYGLLGLGRLRSALAAGPGGAAAAPGRY